MTTINPAIIEKAARAKFHRGYPLNEWETVHEGLRQSHRDSVTRTLAPVYADIQADTLREAAETIDDGTDDWEQFKNRRPDVPHGWSDDSIHDAIASSGVLTDWMRTRADELDGGTS